MSVNNIMTPGAIFLNDDNAASESGLAGFASVGLSTGIEVRTLRGIGGLWETTAAINKTVPGLTFGTTQIETLLGWTAGTFRCVKSVGAGKYGLDAFLSKHDQCNARDDADSEQYRFGNGLLVPRSFECSHAEQATMTAELHPIGDASNAPMVVSSGVAMPATAAAEKEHFTMYNHTVGGVDLPGCKNVQIDFGVQVTKEMADADLVPTWVSVGSITTRITLRGINPRWLGVGAIPLGGRKLLHGDTTLRFARYVDSDADSFMDLPGNHHLTISTYGLAYVTTPASGSGDGSPAENEVQIICLHDGSNVPLGISTGVALAA